jgi:hypothetical protein
MLGQGDPQVLTAIMKATSQQQPDKVLQALDQAWTAGLQAGQLTRQLIEAWRADLKRAVAEGNLETISAEVAAIEALLPVVKTTWPELALEAALVRLASGVTTTSVPAPQRAIRQAAPTAPASGVKAAKPAASPSVASSGFEAESPAPTQAASGDLWMKALTLIKQKNNGLYALLRSCETRFEGDELIIGCKFVFFRDRIQEGKNIEMIEKILARVYGRKLKVRAQLETKAPVPSSQTHDPAAELMSSALEILGGEVIHD